MNTSPPDPDDPRLTAYALGEVSDAERTKIELVLAGSAEAQAEVEQTRALALALTAAYAGEQAEYLSGGASTALTSKVVEFAPARRGGWTGAVRPALKIAALVMAAALLCLLFQWRTPAPVRQVAAVPPTLKTSDARAPLATPGQPSPPDTGSLALAERPEPAAVDAMPNGSEPFAERAAEKDAAGSSLTVNGGPPPDSTDQLRTAQLAALPPKAMVAAAATRRDGPASLPGAAGASAPAAPVLDAAEPAASMAKSFVRIRLANGAILSGVVVGADGLVLADRSLTDADAPTALLADRELSASLTRESVADGMSLLHIRGASLPAVPLARKSPGANSQLSLAVTDPETGVTSLVPARTTGTGLGVQPDGPLAGETRFAFNPAGELLLVEATPPKKLARSTAESLYRSSPAQTLLVRPFTPAERAMLRPISKSPDR